jgi:hypothetical protein
MFVVSAEDGHFDLRPFLQIPVVSTRSDIFRGETSLLGDPRQHPWSDLFIVVECENDVLPPRPRKGSVRAGLSLNRPPDPLKARKQPSRLD